MGIYLNPGTEGFAESLRSEIYVDKTGLIACTNKVLGTRQKYVCVSRPRRFGKSMAAEMLAAYYGRGCDSKELFQGKDDVLTLLVHLGYLAYSMEKKEVFIPNQEIEYEFATAIKGAGWEKAIAASEELLEATLQKDAEAVARGLEEIHGEASSILTYNNENSLSCAVSLAYFSARASYKIVRELPAGKGFADLVFLPRKNHLDKPAIVVELKWNQSAEGAISQILEKQYAKSLEGYAGKILLVGINYDKAAKSHQCIIQEVTK